MRRILVTGGSGFIGRHAVSTLSACGHAVVALTSRPRCHVAGATETIAFDLLSSCDFGALARTAQADTLLHLAWETRHGYFWSAPENLDWLAASVQLVKAFREAGGRRAVVAGTCAEYANGPEGLCHATKTPCAPLHLYSSTKDSLNRVLTSYAAVSGLSFAWGRVFNPMGEGESAARLVPAAWQALRAGQAFATGAGDKRLDVMDTRDCGSAFASLALSTVAGPINIASGVPVSIKTILLALAEQAGRPDLIAFGSRPEPPGSITERWADVSPLHSEVGFRQQYSLRDALAAATGCPN